MSDPLKKYIQQAKHQFDVEQPDPDLFGKILAQLEQEEMKPLPVKRNFSYSFQWLAVAASLVFLIVCGVLLFNTQSTTNPELAQKQTSSQSQSDEHLPATITNTDQQVAMNSKDAPTHNNTMGSQSKELLLNESEAGTVALNVSTKNELNHVVNLGEKNQPTTELNIISDPLKMATEVSDVANNVENSQNHANEISGQQIVNKEEIAANEKSSSSEKLMITPNTQALTEKGNSKESNVITQGLVDAQKNVIEKESVSENQNLKGFIKKGFFNFLSKKAKKWSGDALSIENQGKKDETILALHFKNEKFEFSKAIHF